jgi:hypothetical protein
MKNSSLIKGLLVLVVLALPVWCFAEPYIAVREGLKCSVCHANHTGGGKRTKMGTGVGAQDLPWKKVDLNAKKIPHFFWLKEDFVSIGGDFRFDNNSVFEEYETENTFETQEADLYLQVRLLPDHLSFYADESLAPGGVQSREVFGAIENLPGYGWVKFGKIFIPYGLRLHDDTAFIREAPGFNMDNADVGAEVGFEPGPWTIVASFTNGTAGALDNNAGKLVVGSVIFVQDAFRIGASGSFNPTPTGDKNSGAAFAGLHLGPAVLLGEADYIHDDSFPTQTRNQIVLHSELDYLIHQGWNVKVAYEYYDPDRSVAENERDRFVIGVEPFITPFVQASVFYTFNQSIPQNEAQNADELTFQLHLYF